MGVPIKIPDDLQLKWGCREITLESSTMNGRASRAHILVHRVNLASSLFLAKSQITKYSLKEFAIPRAKCLRLATPEYYRNYEGDACGIRDEMEGRYQEDIRTYLTRSGTLDAVRSSMVSGHVTHKFDDFWMFCTSQEPMWTREREHLRMEFKANCDTTIEEPSEFARVLGEDFAAHWSWSDVCLNPLVDVFYKNAAINEQSCDKIVSVYHGPVLYTDEATKFVGSIPLQHRAAAVSFVKRQNFAHQREYRFILQSIGSPKNIEHFVPISSKLRRLTTIKWEAR